MDRGSATRLLKGGKDGIKEWNRRIEEGEAIPDLMGINLRDENLTGVHINGANLKGANLRDGNLSHSQFEGTCLSGADLRGVCFNSSNLKNADLRKSNLNGADLRWANLERTNFTEAILGETVFGLVDISRSDGLSKCIHRRPSVIDSYTLAVSNNIPLEFLRGVGLEEWQIVGKDLFNLKLNNNQINDVLYKMYEVRSDKAYQYYSCFISYNHDDKEFAHHLYDRLVEININVWLDEHQALPGDDLRDEIDRGIKGWDKFVLCCSESSLNSYWVNEEIDRILLKEERLFKAHGKRIPCVIPLILDDFYTKWENSRAETLKTRIYQDVREWRNEPMKLKKAIERIVMALRADPWKKGQAPDPKL